MSEAFTLQPLALPVDAALSGMTFPAYRHLLRLEPAPRHPELGETNPVLAFGVVARDVDGRAVGLALAEAGFATGAEVGATAPSAPSGDAELLSVFVAPEVRHRGIATMLVAAMERAARERGHQRLHATYTTGRPAIDWMESVFARRQWPPPRSGSLVARFTPQAALATPRFAPPLLRRYRSGLEVFPWRTMTAADLDRIRAEDAEVPWVEPALAAWKFDPATADPSSLGARLGDRVVGWVINHRATPHAVRWSISYMHPSLAVRGKIMALYHASLELLAADPDCRECTFTTPYGYGPMVAFSKRWIGEFASAITESRLVEVDLATPRGAA